MTSQQHAAKHAPAPRQVLDLKDAVALIVGIIVGAIAGG